VTLPKIYREIGRRVAKSPKVPAALKHHFDAIARLKPAADAKDAAAIAELREVYAALGQEAVERYGDKAVPKDLATHLADALAKQKSLAAVPQRTPAPPLPTAIPPARVQVDSALPVFPTQPINQRRRGRRGNAYLLIGGLLAMIALAVAAVMFWPSIQRRTVASTSATTQRKAGNNRSAAAVESPQAADQPTQRGQKHFVADFQRVPRPLPEEPDPGWAVQALHRAFRAQRLRENTPLGQMLGAYQMGLPRWQNPDGSFGSVADLGLPDIDWNRRVAVPPCRDAAVDSEPFVEESEEEHGTRVTLSPIKVLDDLLCSVSFLVIKRNQENARAVGLDYLAVQVELFGPASRSALLTTHPQIQPDTFVDFWSSSQGYRYTVSKWRRNQPAGHITVQTYAPLLFEVLNNDPDYMFVEDQKLSLSPRFQKGCRILCDKVLELRRAQGQRDLPTCQMP
jgi:hypothetical protein